MDEAVPAPPGVEDILEVELGPYVVRVPTGFGPRILGLRRGQGPELFARLGDHVSIASPHGTYRFRGGHRLWAAPEIPSLTYADDDHPCEVTVEDRCVTIAAPPDGSGIAKEIEIRWQVERLIVAHRLTNAGPRAVSIAPWAITQFRLGGVAIVPFGRPSEGSPQPDRSLVLWPYTDLTDARVAWHSKGLLLGASPGPRWKIGVGPDPRMLGYAVDGLLFVKEIPPAGGGDHPDRGAVGQLFVDDQFCELESVGPTSALTPGESARHTEIWTVEECDRAEATLELILERSSR